MQKRAFSAAGFGFSVALELGVPHHGWSFRLNPSRRRAPGAGKARGYAQLAAMLLAQCDHLVAKMQFESPQRLVVRTRFRTRHRGVADDDRARALFQRALAAKYTGQRATHDRLLAELSGIRARRYRDVGSRPSVSSMVLGLLADSLGNAIVQLLSIFDSTAAGGSKGAPTSE